MTKGLFPSTWWRSQRGPLGTALGHLEHAVMDVVWQESELSVRDVQARLPRRVAYTTVMTTLDRLFKKNFVDRRREGRAFLYRAALPRDEMEASMTTGLVTEVLSYSASGARPFLSHLVDVVAERDDRLLAELERLVRDKRRQLKGQHE